MQQQPVKVFVVDDHTVVRRGLRADLETVDDMEVIGEAADGQEALEQIAALVAAGRPPDVVLMDLLMAGMDGVTTTAAITDRHPELAVVAMTSFTQADMVHGALRPAPPGICSRMPRPTRSPPRSGPPAAARCIWTRRSPGNSHAR